MPVISLVGAKGGSLKTSSALSVSALLAQQNSQVALLDADPQHSATLALPRLSVLDDGTAEEIPWQGVDDPLSADPVVVDLDGQSRIILHRGGRPLVHARREEVHTWIDAARSRADVVVIDTLPAITDAVVAAMERSDLIVIPTEATADALRVLPGVVDVAAQVVRSGGKIRLLLTRVDRRERITDDARRILDRDYPGLLYNTAIPADVRAKEAAWYLRPVVLYDPQCRASQAYRRLLRDVADDLGLPVTLTQAEGNHGEE